MTLDLHQDTQKKNYNIPAYGTLPVIIIDSFSEAWLVITLLALNYYSITFPYHLQMACL